VISNILNITFSIEESILGNWKGWFEKFQTQILEEGLTTHVRYLELKGAKEPGVIVHCVHLEFKATSDVHNFYSTSYVQMGQQLKELFGEKCLYFGSLLELLSEKISD